MKNKSPFLNKKELIRLQILFFTKIERSPNFLKMASTLSNFFYKMLNRSILQYIITILQSKSILQFAEKSGTECESGVKHTNAP